MAAVESSSTSILSSPLKSPVPSLAGSSSPSVLFLLRFASSSIIRLRFDPGMQRRMLSFFFLSVLGEEGEDCSSLDCCFSSPSSADPPFVTSTSDGTAAPSVLSAIDAFSAEVDRFTPAKLEFEHVDPLLLLLGAFSSSSTSPSSITSGNFSGL